MKLISNLENALGCASQTTARKFLPAKSNTYLAIEQFLKRGVIIRLVGTTPYSYIHPWSLKHNYPRRLLTISFLLRGSPITHISGNFLQQGLQCSHLSNLTHFPNSQDVIQCTCIWPCVTVAGVLIGIIFT